jgi:hypothetical protein
MSAEYGIFNDEGALEGGFYNRDTAVGVLETRYADDPQAYVAEACPDHPDHPRESCEECDSEDEDAAEQ